MIPDTCTDTQTADTIIDARWIVPVVPEQRVLSDHSLVIRNGRILDLLPTREAQARYSAPQHFTLKDHTLIPGLVNLHTHGAMTLLRGLADDLPLMEWLKGHIWPAENRHISREFAADGTLLGCGEMLRSGTTTFNDMYFFPEGAADAVETAGIRAALGIIVVDFPTPYAADADDYLTKGLALRDAHKENPQLSFCLAPHAPYTVSDKTFGKILTYAAQLDLTIHIHLHETEDEIRQSQAQFHMRPLARLHSLGLLGPNFLAVHGVHLNEDEMTLLTRHGCSLAHCPASNLKLASGIAQVAALLDHGINVGIGTDGAASNNRQDMFAEMRLAALLAKGASGQADAVPAHQALRMATLNGAKALGLDQAIGSLEIGKMADIAAVRLTDIESQPCYDVVSHLVYVAGREDVSHVWVAGRLRLEERRLTSLNEDDLKAKAAYWRERIARDAT